jgi:CxxC-x17-CxxC domain-containing protein
LNKEYSKEEYEKLRATIIEDMKKNPYIDPQGRTWSYGEFFPPIINVYGYNESNASKFFHKTKEEALKQGFGWYESNPTQYDVTLPALNLPDALGSTSESITNEVIGCEECGRGYKIAPLEYILLKKMNVPIPHSCPSCRSNARFARLNPIKLWNRTCAKCNKGITTAFDPERSETVYCVDCYQKEMS